MKRILFITLVLALALSFCVSCKKEDDKRSGMKNIEDMKNSALEGDLSGRYPSMSDYAGQSGKRLNDKINEKDEKENGKKDDGSKDKPSDNTNQKDDNQDDMTGIINDRLTAGEHERALTSSEKKKTFQLALSYIKKKLDKSFNNKDIDVADDNSGEYEKYPLYGKGNIIIYEAKVKGNTVFVAIGRLSKDADWKVLNKK